MTREEIDRHVAGILTLRKRRRQRSGLKRGDEFNPRRRQAYSAGANKGDGLVCEVDVMFTTRQRFGWLPRGGDE